MIPREVIQVILNAKQYPHITRIGVFGSYARGDVRENSDLDILIDYDDSKDLFMDEMGRFMEDVEVIFKGKIDYVTMPGLTRTKDDGFRRNVLREVQWLYDVKAGES